MFAKRFKCFGNEAMNEMVQQGEAPEIKSIFAKLFDQEVGELRKRKDRKINERKILPPIS